MSTPVTITVDGEPVRTQAGRTVAASLMLEAGQLAWRSTRFESRPRGVFCGIGVCFDCLVTVDGTPNLRACLVQVAEGMDVTVQDAAVQDAAVPAAEQEAEDA